MGFFSKLANGVSNKIKPKEPKKKQFYATDYDESSAIQKKTGRGGQPIFIENYIDEFIDDCGLADDVMDCNFCSSAGGVAHTHASGKPCSRMLHELAKKHDLSGLHHTLHHKHHNHHHPKHRSSHPAHSSHSTDYQKILHHMHHHHGTSEYTEDIPSLPRRCSLNCGSTKTENLKPRVIICTAIWQDDFVRKVRINLYHSSKGEEKNRSQDTVASLSDKEFTNEMVRMHNIYRERHKVDPIKLSLKLSEKAQEYAEWLLDRGSLEHSDKLMSKETHFNGEPCGENLAYCDGREGHTNLTGSQITNVWYKMKSRYNTKGSEDAETRAGNFTQVVWRASKLIGIGRARINERTLGYCVKNATTQKHERIFVVALYYPRGNVQGYYCQNVFSSK